MMRLSVHNLSFNYGESQILNQISFSAGQGEILSLLGSNGTGKTTLLKCINHILSPKNGQVFVDGKDISQMTLKSRAQYIGYVPQHTNTVFPIRVIDAIMMGRISFASHRFREKDKKIVYDLIEQMDLEKFAFKDINALSGGERQRVIIARALAQEPEVLLLDEPTSSLDMKNQLFTLHMIQKIVQEKQITAVISIHDLNLASMFSNKVMFLHQGEVFAYGSCTEVLTQQNIKTIYGVSTEISPCQEGELHIRLHKNLPEMS